MSVPPPEPERGPARKLAYALLVALLSVGLVELGLALSEEAPTQTTTSRGFDRNAAYFVPDPEREGGWLPNYFPNGWLPFRIPPKGDALRVCMYGGSNTWTFPAHVLQQNLERASGLGPGAFEVINLGRNGYGSERVRILFEQSMKLEPDVVLIYSGHNEFVEMGFKAELESSRGAAAELTGGLAGALRSFRALVLHFTPEASERAEDEAGRVPELYQYEHQKFQDQTYVETELWLDAYADNLRGMCATAREHGALPILCTVVGNQLEAPFVSAHESELPADSRDEILAALEAARASFPERYAFLLSETGNRMHRRDWIHEGRAAAPYDGPTRLRPLLGEYGQRHGWWPEPESWGGRARLLVPLLADFHRRELEPDERASVEQCRAQLGRALALAPDHPRALYALGLTELLVGEPAEAARLLQRAQRFDRAPRCGNEYTNELVRRVAEESSEVELLDVWERVRQLVPHGIVGYELMEDVCHFHPGALNLLMRDFAVGLLPQLERHGALEGR